MHRVWLGTIYEWAGEYRTVNVSKGDFPFAAAHRIPALMSGLEKNVLSRCTPCRSTDRREVANMLAEVHVELVLIHPFRDGNGRIARLLTTLMALQAGLPQLDFTPLTGKGRYVLYGDSAGYGSELWADGADFRGAYRAELRRVLTGNGSGFAGKPFAIVSTLAPVSMAVELDTLVIRSRR